MPLVTKEEMHNYRAVAKDMSRESMESPIFVCGMAPLDSDDPMYDIFRFYLSLECNTRIEAYFYTPRIWLERIELCCHRAGEFKSPVE